jgi:hypothetical protein
MLLADILFDSDFNTRVQEVAGAFRKKAGIPFKVHQAGVVVPNVEKAALELEAKGFGPFMIGADSLPRWTERGKDGHFRGKMGIAYHDGIEIELLEPGEGSDFYRCTIDSQCRPVIQHIGFLTHKVDEWAEKLSKMGCPTWVRGKIKVGPLRIEFAYMDSVREAGTILEFIGYWFAGIPVNPISGLIGAAAWLQKKTGKRCIDLG